MGEWNYSDTKRFRSGKGRWYVCCLQHQVASHFTERANSHSFSISNHEPTLDPKVLSLLSSPMFSSRDIFSDCGKEIKEKKVYLWINNKVWVSRNYLFKVLTGGVFVSTHGPTGEFGFVFAVLPDRQVPPSGEHARRFDFRHERFLNKSLGKTRRDFMNY